MFYSRDNDTSSWYVVLKAPPRGFHELEMYDEAAYIPSTPLMHSKLTRIEMRMMVEMNILREGIVRAWKCYLCKSTLCVMNTKSSYYNYCFSIIVKK